MNRGLIPLHQLPVGRCGRVMQINVTGAARRRMLDLGLTFSTEVAALQKSPSGDPTAYFIRGAVIALRSQDASQILITPVNQILRGASGRGFNETVNGFKPLQR